MQSKVWVVLMEDLDTDSTDVIGPFSTWAEAYEAHKEIYFKHKGTHTIWFDQLLSKEEVLDA